MKRVTGLSDLDEALRGDLTPLENKTTAEARHHGSEREGKNIHRTLKRPILVLLSGCVKELMITIIVMPHS